MYKFRSYGNFFSSEISEKDLLELIQKYNLDKNFNGILVQLPLPRHISEGKVIETSVGRIYFNEILPDVFDFVNESATSSLIKKIFAQIIRVKKKS